MRERRIRLHIYAVNEQVLAYNYEGNCRVCIPQIEVRDITCYEGSVPALAMGY